MAGAISSLGIASGTLTSDVIDKLKDAEKSSTVTPYETRIKENKTRISDLNTLKEMAQSLKTITSSLSGEVSYLGRETSTSGDSVSVTAESGSNVQSFSIDVSQIAQKQIMQSTTTFGGSNETISGSGTLTINIGSGSDINIDISSGSKLQDIKDSIFDQTGGKVIASVLNIGDDSSGNDQYKLVLRSSEEGASNAFTVSGDMATTLGLGSSGIVQNAQDATFTYNGVEISRSTNSIDDLIAGVTINVKETGKTNVNITQKTSNVVDNVKKFVEKYNELVQNLDTVTGFDSEEGVKGTFQGNSEMNTIFRNLKNSVITTGGAMSDFGLELNRDGTLTLDQSTLENKVKTDFDSVMKFFKGTDNQTGLFESANSALESITTSKEYGLFKLIETNLDTNATRLKESLALAQERLDSKYEIMTKRFAAYDAMISTMNNGFATLKQIIDDSSSDS